jgi:hypothetical protein
MNKKKEKKLQENECKFSILCEAEEEVSMNYGGGTGPYTVVSTEKRYVIRCQFLVIMHASSFFLMIKLNNLIIKPTS